MFALYEYLIGPTFEPEREKKERCNVEDKIIFPFLELPYSSETQDSEIPFAKHVIVSALLWEFFFVLSKIMHNDNS